jgi:type IV pilus assembly protein PilC
MVYQYSVYTSDKRIVRGTIDAGSEKMAEEALYRAGYNRVLNLREISPRLNLKQWMPSLFGVKNQDVIDFSRQMALLIESGIPITTALRLLEEQAPSKALAKVIRGLANELQKGNSFAQALAGYPQVFSNTYCQVIKASELSGNFEVSLRRAADYMEKEINAGKKVQRSLIYPLVVLAMAFGVSILVTTVVLPSLTRLFTALGAQLPWTTRVLMAFGGFIIDYKYYIPWVMIAVILLILGYMKLPSGKENTDKMALKIPIFGSIIVQRSLGSFCQTTSMLLKAGLPLPQIMNVVTGTVSNVIISRALVDVREKLVQGRSLSQSMASIGLFPRLLVEMTVVGETSGNLDTTLETMADYYSQRVEQRVQVLISLMEPALITVVGLVVAFIAISMITPLYSILKSIH